MNNKKITVTICMGSSCFSRGNAAALTRIEDYIETSQLQERVELTGSLCMEDCSQGPNIIIDGTVYSKVHPDCVIDLLHHHLG
jgi:NADH:ubiquinone oxidoreductase subunit E